MREIRLPPPEGEYDLRYRFKVEREFYRSPYDTPADVPAPATVKEAAMLSAAARAYSRTDLGTGAFVAACVCQVAGDKFELEADVSEVLAWHGPGVYTVRVWATLDGGSIIISAVSVFHEAKAPEGYVGQQIRLLVLAPFNRDIVILNPVHAP